MLTGAVFLPDGHTPAVAAVVDLLRADPTGRPVPGSAFARAVTDLDGRFTLNPPERPDLVTAARATGGVLPVAVQVGDLAPHGSIDPDADSTRRPDVSGLTGLTLLTLAGGSGDDFTIPVGPIQVYRVFDLVGEPPGLDEVVLPDPSLLYDGVEVVLDLADDATDTAQVAGMFTDPDLVAGNDDVNDPDVVPPLGAIMTDVVPVLDPVNGESDGGVGGVPGVSLSRVGQVLTPTGDDDPPPNCLRDAGTQWFDARHGNNIEGTKTYVYLDTYSCTTDSDRYRDQVVYKWGGYTASADKHWTIYRLKYRTEVNDKVNYRMKYPDPDGDVVDGDGGSLTWSVGFDYVVGSASVGGTYHFRGKKIHGWQSDGTGKLYHVSWIAGSKGGAYGDGFNNGGGVYLDVPQGSDGRAGVKNDVIVWRCYYPNNDDNSGPQPGNPQNANVTCSTRTA